MTSMTRVKEASLAHAARVVRMCCVVACIGAANLFAGCATSEEMATKSEGYYQEGVASLSGDRQKAFVSFQKSVQLNPNNKNSRYALGHVYALQGKLSRAEEEFRAAINIDEDYSEAHTYLGQVLANQNRWDEAIKSYRKALTNPLYPTPDLARFHLGRALAHQGDLQGSMEALEDAITVSPSNVPPAMIQLELGRVYYKLGYTEKAREALKKVTTVDKGGEYAAAATELLARLK
ncbi:MAG: tetratricopeptide repeat protein [Nitrospiraceae bacterium]|nr:tetratricopeptide repeat protein [Nitrospiraceae bacterium]